LRNLASDRNAYFGRAHGPAGEGSGTQRWDIQALRGWSVALVLLYHCDIAAQSGFLGVDIFFVISGYLITRSISADLEKGRFDLVNFYLRRAIRLLPALYATVAILAIISVFAFTPPQRTDFWGQVEASLLFYANVYLKNDTDYFGIAAETKPLLHLWSLSLEWQFYLVLPVILMFMPKGHRRQAVLIITIVSLLLCFLGAFSPRSRFFLVVPRLWELGFGSLAALYGFRASPLVNAVMRLAALLVIAITPFFPPFGAQPGFAAFCVVSATTVFVSTQPVTRRTFSLPLVALGDISYSLYLAHWPTIVVLRQVWLTPDRTLVNIVAFGGALIGGSALYHLVEKPLRKRRSSTTIAGLGLTATTLTLWAVSVPYVWLWPKEYQGPVYGLAHECAQDGDKFSPITRCMTSAAPDAIVWGDSFAMHLIPGLVATNSAIGIVQATKSVCGPTPGLAPFQDEASSSRTRRWAGKCISFNQSVLDYIVRTPSIKTVILSSQMTQYLRPEWRLLDERPNDSHLPPFTASLRRLAASLRGLNKRVVFIAPPPGAYFDIQSCVERTRGGGWSFGPDASCGFKLSEYHASAPDVLGALRSIEEGADMPVIRLDSALCKEGACIASKDGRALYADHQHLSADGSRYVVRQLSLYNIIERVAR